MFDPHLFQARAEEIGEIGRFLFDRGWSPATSSNYSCRLDPEHVAITVSGRHKDTLTPVDIMVVDMQGRPVEADGRKPSAETLLHTQLYAWDARIGAVLHTHSVNATVLSKRYAPGRYLRLEDYEVLKAFTGQASHEGVVDIPIFRNDQDIPRLAGEVGRFLVKHPGLHGYLIAGHGLYTWGRGMEDARRHVEAFEFLFECEVLNLRLDAAASHVI